MSALKLVAAPIAVLLFTGIFTSQAGAAYIPDNNGHWRYHSPDTGYRHSYNKRFSHKRSHKRHARHHRRSKRTTDANGNRGMPWNMVKVKTVQGFYLTVNPAYAHKFLRFFEILAQNNVDVPKNMVGCYSRGGHVRGSNHYIGAACDIQTSWNKTIPALYNASKWIKQAGLYDGCSFGDCGHIEAVRGTHNKAPNLYTAMAKFKADESTAAYQP